MAHIVADRVKESASTTGTGSFTLSGAASGFRAFSSVLTADGDTTSYCAVNGAEWEVGLGTRSSSTVLARTTVLASSNAGALVNFSAAPTVFLSMVANHLTAVLLLTKTSDQSIANSTAAVVNWDVQSENTISAWVIGSPSRITVPAGYSRIRLVATTVWASNSTGNRWLQFTKNGVAIREGSSVKVATVESYDNGTYGWAPVVAGDYFEVTVQQTSGAALNLTGVSGVTLRAEFR